MSNQLAKDDEWKTINGAKVLLGEGGEIKGGLGGKYTGQKLSALGKKVSSSSQQNSSSTSLPVSSEKDWSVAATRHYTIAHAAAEIRKIDKVQAEALKKYTDDAYEEINGGLRHPPPSSTAAVDITHLDSLFDETGNRTQADIVTYRAADAPIYDNLQPGQIYRDNGYSSTTTNSKTLGEFSGETRRGTNASPTEIEVRIPKGSKALSVGNHTVYPSEQEILVNRGARYRVVSVGQPSSSNFSRKIVVELLETA